MSNARIDIRRIQLYKEFREVLGSNHSSRSAASWQVFGYYDAMDIDDIKIKTQKHALETVLEDSQRQSLKNEGIEKKHIIYAIGVEESYKNHKDFWDKQHQYPILLVSLVQFRHPIEGSVQKLLRSIKSRAARYIANVDIEFSLYMSMDCNDIIIFWLGNSIQKIMKIITNLSLDLHKRISQVFTIHACRKVLISLDNSSLHENEQKLLQNWEHDEPKFKHVGIYINGKSYRDMLCNVHKLVEDYNHDRHYEESKAKYELIPGQEDVILDFSDIPLKDFIKLHCKKKEIDTDCGVYSIGDSRTVIYTQNKIRHLPIDVKSEDPENTKTTEPKHDKRKSPKHAYKLVQEFTKLKEDLEHKNIHTFPVWFQPLMELLIELCNLETSPTAYDIYRQEISCHKVFVEELITESRKVIDSIPKNKKMTMFRLSDNITQNIQRYLNGWSQLSFHAMHAEWQLTQTADINRLYLFPAKLSRLYCAFMHESSRVLNTNTGHKPSMFFLTPNVLDEAEFISVFRPCNKAEVLIHGEVSADHMFMPQILLPILVHEAAHYSGQRIRNRFVRYNSMLRSIIAAIVACYINMEYLEQKFQNGIFIYKELIDIICRDFPDPEHQYPKEDRTKSYPETFSYYSWEIRAHILGTLQHQLSSTPFFLNGPFKECLFKLPNYRGYTAVQSLLHIKEMLNPEEDYKNVMNEKSAGNLSISIYFDELMTIYQEAFSDVCMIKLLDLRIEDYLNIIHRGNRYNSKMTEEDITSIKHTIRSRRYLACISAIWGNEINQLKRIRRCQCVSRQIRELAGHLIEIATDDDLDRRIYEEFAQHELVKYLKKVVANIDYLCCDKYSPDKLQSVYRALAVDFNKQENSIMDLLEPCLRMMSENSTDFEKESKKQAEMN